MSSIIERIFGRTSPTAPASRQLPPPESASLPVLLPMAPTPSYQQWYDKDQELLNSEKESLEARGFTADCSILPNARVCFTVTIAGKHTALICGYGHPMEPVTVQLLDDVDAPTVVDSMGQVDLFAHDGFIWNADIRLGDVAQRVATLLSVAGMKSSSAALKTSPRGNGTADSVESIESTPNEQPPSQGVHSSARSGRRVPPVC